MPGIAIIGQMAYEVTAAREHGRAEFPERAQIAHHRIADVCGCRRKIRLRQGAADELARSHQYFLGRACPESQAEDGNHDGTFSAGLNFEKSVLWRSAATYRRPGFLVYSLDSEVCAS